ncbi:MAG: D-glycero-beta-D-manno-heptose 1-phosphate adenylyltransferase [bacterium]|nr:D-glycero-beta-D-manno-heptose 1-phosphate adenylyltransferase [bacterium]
MISINKIAQICKDIRKKDLTIVTSNGCFDILHTGHIEYLHSASLHGDILIIGINSNNSVRKLKGEGRPVNNELSRASIIASLGFVDYCVVFSQDTPVELLEIIKPDIHIKGGDYLPDEIIEKKTVEENGGVVRILPLVEGYSTTSILKNITSQID